MEEKKKMRPNVTETIPTEERPVKASTITCSSLSISTVLSTPSKYKNKIELDVDTSERFRSELNRLDRHFDIGNAFAEGGFGEVFRAKDRVLGRTIAVKSLKKELLDNGKAVSKFIMEAKLSAQLDHPSIVPVYDLSTDSENGLHLSMKLVDGMTVKDFILQLRLRHNKEKISREKESRSLHLRLESFIKVCEAIDYCHTRHIIHCDLKPENIMFGRHGEVYIMDWGSAKKEGANRRGALEGTPAYIAPEVFETGETLPSGDIFALGMMLFELVTLQQGVCGDSQKELIMRIRGGSFEPVKHFAPHIKIPSPLAAIINKARSFDKELRYKTAKELGADIRHFLFMENVNAYQENALQHISRIMFRHQAWSVAIAAGLLILCLGVASFNVVRRISAEHEIDRKTLTLIKLQQKTAAEASEINNHMVRVREQLNAFVSATALELENAKKNPPGTVWVETSNFKNRETMPPGSRYSLAYGTMVSLNSEAVFKRSPGFDINLTLLRHLGKNFLLNDMTAPRAGNKTQAQKEELFFEYSGLLRRLSICFSDGTIVRYPGMFETALPEFQTDTETISGGNRFEWSYPRFDSSRQCVISCRTELKSISGKKHGSVIFDIAYDELMKNLAMIPSDKRTLAWYVIDQSGNVIFPLSDSSLNEYYGSTRYPWNDKPFIRKFYNEELMNQIKKGVPRQFKLIHNGRKSILTWAAIPSVSWALIQIKHD